jgi:hypothetical protein
MLCGATCMSLLSLCQPPGSPVHHLSPVTWLKLLLLFCDWRDSAATHAEVLHTWNDVTLMNCILARRYSCCAFLEKEMGICCCTLERSVSISAMPLSDQFRLENCWTWSTGCNTEPSFWWVGLAYWFLKNCIAEFLEIGQKTDLFGSLITHLL